jgi:hypothetical protein
MNEIQENVASHFPFTSRSVFWTAFQFSKKELNFEYQTIHSRELTKIFFFFFKWVVPLAPLQVQAPAESQSPT